MTKVMHNEKGMELLQIDTLLVGNRYREEFGDVKALARSIDRYGLLHPIVVDSKGQLVAGERRLRACKSLEWKTIPARRIDEVSEDIKKEIELEENIKRKDFTWQEQVKAVRDLFKVKQKIGGISVKGKTGGFTLADLASYLGVSVGTISQDISLANAMDGDEELEFSKNKLTALKLHRSKKEKAILRALSEKITVNVSNAILIKGDATLKLPKLESESADMVFTDPPFGKNLEMKADLRTGEKPYEDNPVKVFQDLQIVVKEYYRILKNDRVMLMFFDIIHYHKVITMCEEVGFLVCALPLFWCKTGGGGACPNDTYYAMNTECILHCQKGSRPLNNPGQPNFKVCERVPSQQKIHETQRPIELLKYYIEQHTLPDELVVDGYAGSFSVGVSAIELGRKVWGCEKKEENYAKALLALEELKNKEIENV